MAEIKRGQPIDLDKLAADRARQRADVAKVLTDIKGSMAGSFPMPFAAMMTGQEKREVVGDDGKKQLVDWDQDSLMDWFSKGRRRDEEAGKERMIEEVSLGMSFMQAHFLKRPENDPQRAEGMAVVDLTMALSDRLARRDAGILYEYPLETTQGHVELEHLEAVRRTVLKPTYILHEGVGRNGLDVDGYDEDAYYEDIEERFKPIEEKAGGIMDTETVRRLQREAIGDNLEGYSNSDWSKITSQLSRYYRRFLAESLDSSVHQAKRNLEFTTNLARGGEYVFPDEVLQPKYEELGEMADIAKEVNDQPNIASVQLVIKERMGERASFKDLLDRFHPVQDEITDFGQ